VHEYNTLNYNQKTGFSFGQGTRPIRSYGYKYYIILYSDNNLKIAGHVIFGEHVIVSLMYSLIFFGGRGFIKIEDELCRFPQFFLRRERFFVRKGKGEREGQWHLNWKILESYVVIRVENVL
jgi:hypothetical protein